MHIEYAQPRLLLGLPTPFVNIYNSIFNGWYENTLNECYYANKIPLQQYASIIENELGDIKTQSIVHVNLGVIEEGKTYRIKFLWETPLENHVQIFVRPASATTDNNEIQYDADSSETDPTPGYKTVYVMGDGSSAINLYLRPTKYARSLFLRGVFWEEVS